MRPSTTWKIDRAKVKAYKAGNGKEMGINEYGVPRISRISNSVDGKMQLTSLQGRSEKDFQMFLCFFSESSP